MPSGGLRGPTQAPPPATSTALTPFPHRGDTSCPQPTHQEWVPSLHTTPAPTAWIEVPYSPTFQPLKSPVCTQEGPPKVGWIWLPPKEPGHACQGRRLVWEPPERANTLITLEVTGLRGGLKRNWLLFTDTIWTQPISSPFPVHSPARGAGAGVTPDPAPSVPSPVPGWPVPGWPVPWIPSSQRQRGEYCLRQGILTSPQCQPSAEPGNASLEPRGPCAARLAPREGDAAPEKAGAEAAGTHRVKASLETALREQPSLRLSCRAGHRHAGTWHGRVPTGRARRAVAVRLSFTVPRYSGLSLTVSRGLHTRESRPRPRCLSPSFALTCRGDGGTAPTLSARPAGDTGTSSPRFQHTTPRGTSSPQNLTEPLSPQL